MANSKSDPIQTFCEERKERIASYMCDASFQRMSQDWVAEAFRKQFMYNFEALGRPIIQLPADIIAISELIWEVKPDIVVETGIAHGGSIIHSASQLAILDMCDAIEKGESFDPRSPARKVIAVDIDIRPHNRAALEAHPMISRIDLLEGSSLSDAIINDVYDRVDESARVLVILDSNHTHDHVLGELRAYAPLVSNGSYCAVFDTVIEDLPVDFFSNRPWNPGDSPQSAIREFINECQKEGLNDRFGNAIFFEVDHARSGKLLITAAPGGFLRRYDAD